MRLDYVSTYVGHEKAVVIRDICVTFFIVSRVNFGLKNDGTAGGLLILSQKSDFQSMI